MISWPTFKKSIFKNKTLFIKDISNLNSLRYHWTEVFAPSNTVRNSREVSNGSISDSKFLFNKLRHVAHSMQKQVRFRSKSVNSNLTSSDSSSLKILNNFDIKHFWIQVFLCSSVLVQCKG
eukprot:NODE_252_length_11723_cov_1.965933.p9 type:complete len:121 gc:universal NODE_252_length_11723_cov_1.965933:11571-11209(-)